MTQNLSYGHPDKGKSICPQPSCEGIKCFLSPRLPIYINPLSVKCFTTQPKHHHDQQILGNMNNKMMYLPNLFDKATRLIN